VISFLKCCAVGVFFLSCLSLQATVINLESSLPLGNLPDTETIGAFTMTGWTVSKADNTVWSNSGVIMDNRDETPNDVGVGICSNFTNCPTSGNGNINEIDNNGSTFEVLRFAFATPTFLVSFGLSSLDSGLKDGFAIFGSNTAQPNISTLTALASGTNTSEGGVINPTVTIDATFQYYFVTSLKRTASDSGSDFLVQTVTYAPEPITISMVGLGLIGIGLLRRRRS
jgi:hypothetical protein